MSMIKVTCTSDVQLTPEITAYLAKIEKRLNDEVTLRASNLLIYGTTHPEGHVEAIYPKGLFHAETKEQFAVQPRITATEVMAHYRRMGWIADT